MRDLIQLRLPQLVEAQKKREDELEATPLQLSRSSTLSDLPSPVTPNSIRGHARFPSSSSSLASSPVLRGSCDGLGLPKRLTGVKEEPHEKDEALEAFDGFDNVPAASEDNSFDSVYIAQSSRSNNNISPFPGDYDLADATQIHGDDDANPYAKRRRGESPFTGFTTRFSTRLPSLSQKWRRRRPANIITDAESPMPILSRANSVRIPSIDSSIADNRERHDHQPPATPTKNATEEHPGNSTSPIEINRATIPDAPEEAETLATTPLLPPLMMPHNVTEEPLQSPLQSPAIADQESIYSIHTPIVTPRLPGITSPPLSAKPSNSSFNRQRGITPLLPSSEIPPIMIADQGDEWALKLGHANFSITPEPYVPSTFDFRTLRQLRADRDLARCNYMKHLMRTGEHYGATSKIYNLTEGKWDSINAQWKKNVDQATSETTNHRDSPLSTSESSATEPVPIMKMPSLNGPKSEGKFPKLGDEDVVGPMEQVAPPAQPQRKASRKTTFFKFFQGLMSPGGRPSWQRTP